MGAEFCRSKLRIVFVLFHRAANPFSCLDLQRSASHHDAHLPSIHNPPPENTSHSPHGASQILAVKEAALPSPLKRLSVVIPKFRHSDDLVHRIQDDLHAHKLKSKPKDKHRHRHSGHTRCNNDDLADLLGNSTSDDWLGMDLKTPPDQPGSNYKSKCAYDDMMATLKESKKELNASKKLDKPTKHANESKQSHKHDGLPQQLSISTERQCKSHKQLDAPHETPCHERRHKSQPNQHITTNITPASSPCRESHSPVVRQWVWPSGDEVCAPVAHKTNADMAMVVLGCREVGRACLHIYKSNTF